MEMGTYSSDGANRISLDGVSYDISNLVLKSSDEARTQRIYPTNLLSLNDDEIVLDDSHHYRNSAAKQTSLYATESLGLDNVFSNSMHLIEDLPARGSNHSTNNSMSHSMHSSQSMHNSRTMHISHNSSRLNHSMHTSPTSPGPRVKRLSGERRGMLSYRPDDDDDDSVCGGYQDPVRNALSSPVTSPRGVVNKSSSHQRDAWGQRIPLKTPYNDIQSVTAKSIGAKGASNEKLNELLNLNRKDNNDSDTSMGVDSLMIEIMPGYSEPLRGSAETIKAHMSGNIVRIHCVCCDQDISCVGDAAYVLCPTCTVVSPTPSDRMDGNSSWGVGLGFLADQFNVDDGMLSRTSSLAESSYSRNF